MIGFRWSTSTEGPCPNCHQPVVAKKKYLTIAGIPIPLGGPKRSCGCTAATGAQPQPGMPMQGQPGMPMQAQPQQTPVYPCLQCRTTLQWVAQHQRWYCATCQQYR